MMRYRKLMEIIVLFLIFGCGDEDGSDEPGKEGGEGDNAPPSIGEVVEELVGTWQRLDEWDETETITLNEDATCAWNDAEGDDLLCIWGVDDGQLLFYYEYKEKEGGKTYLESGIEESTFKLVDGVLYLEVLLHDTGDDSLDGIWEFVGGESEDGYLNDEIQYEFEATWTLSVTITGGSYSLVESEVEYEAELGKVEEGTETYEETGTIREENGVVYLQPETSSDPDVEDLEELPLGYRIDENTIVPEAQSEAEAVSYGYTKI